MRSRPGVDDARRAPGGALTGPGAGFTLIELLAVLAVLGLLAAVAVPAVLSATSRLRVSLAAHEAAAILQRARMLAVRSRVYVAVRFDTDGETVTWALYGDGDGDGVRSRDIDRGVDPRLQQPIPLRRTGASVRLGFPEGRAPRAPGGRGRIDRRHDPVRFNRSDMASFSPTGTSTPGSLYFTDGTHLAAVRLFGRSGKVKVIVYDPETETWE
ncbi:MAG: prepilin-type N-terminal cleavage/methylation domain-containing protein [Thermoanaerobaculia bacterium]